MRHFTSDLHLGHVNILRYEPRPFASVSEMDAGLVERWNAVVAPDDEVVVVGDLAMGRLARSLELVAHLNGRKVLVPGNHDAPAHYRSAAARGRTQYLAAGIDEIVDGPTTFEVGGQPVLVDHFPYEGDSQDADRYAEQRPVDRGMWLVHGHVHGRWRQRGRMINVGVDAWGGRPVPESTIAELVEAGPGELAPLPW